MTKDSGNLKLIVVISLILSLIQLVSSQVTNVTINVSNVPPTVNSIIATSPVILNPDITNVWCNSSVKDENGLVDIMSKKAVFWNIKLSREDSIDNPASHYTLTSVEINPKDSISGILYGNFSLSRNVIPGTWRCMIKVNDSGGLVAYNTTDITVYSDKCSNKIRDENELLIDCGGNCQPCIINDDIYLEIPPEKHRTMVISIRSTTPEIIEITEFLKSNLTFYDTFIESKNIVIKTEGTTLIPNSSLMTRVDIYVPIGTKIGTYKGTIRIITNTAATSDINVTVNVRSSREKYMYIIVNGTEDRSIRGSFCMNNPVIVTLLDEDTNRIIEDAELKAYINRKILYTNRTNSLGQIQFIPYTSGTILIKANKSRYYPTDEIANILTCGELSIECDNGIQDSNEEGVDCGGDCYPCHCFDGIQNFDEKSIDCGDSCPDCPEFASPRSLMIFVPSEVPQGKSVTIAVGDDQGNPLRAIVKVRKPDNSTIVKKTNNEGQMTLIADKPDIWEFKVMKPGYLPADTKMTVVEEKAPPMPVSSLPKIKYFDTILIVAGILVILLLIYAIEKKTRQK